MIGDLVYRPPRSPLEILFEDNSVLAVDKPEGLLTVPGKRPDLADCLFARVQSQYEDALLIHRLDLSTSGVVVFARNRAAQRNIGLQFERRHAEKIYHARVHGIVAPPAGKIELPLAADWPNRPLQKVDFDDGRPAVTEWEVLNFEQDASRLKLMPKTGRSHQLRVHMKEIGHPIIGDPLYGCSDSGIAADRLQLHAHLLRIRHPENGKEIAFTSPCPF